MEKNQANINEDNLLFKALELRQKHGFNLQDRAEKRVAFFIAIATAMIALTIKTNTDQILILLIILLSFGIETLHFINWTKINQYTNEIASGILDRKLIQISPTFGLNRKVIKEIDKETSLKWFYNIRGGLAEFMYLCNSFLIAGIMYIILSKMGNGVCKVIILLIIIILFILSIVLQYKISQKIRKSFRKKIQDSQSQQTNASG